MIRTHPSHFNAINFKILVPPELFNEIEALYAPPDHPVFELVPQAFHKHVSNIYTAIGQLEVTVKTFWDIFRSLLDHLHEGPNEQLTEIITNHNATLEPGLDNMPLLLNMEAFQLGQLLDLGANTNYIGGLEDPASNSDMGPSPEYADFTDD